MTEEHRRVSVNTSLRDANIFEDDSSMESLSDLADRIKQEPTDSDEKFIDDSPVDIKSEVCTTISSLMKQEIVEDSPFKTERIEFETKLKFESDDKKEKISVEYNRKERVKSNILKRRNGPFKAGISRSDSEDTKLKFEIDTCKNTFKFEPEDSDVEVKCENISKSNGRESGVGNNLKRRNVRYYDSMSGSDSEDNGVSPTKKRKDDIKDKKSRRRKTRYMESDPEVLRRRQKQIDYGKNTIGYSRYLQEVPRDKRSIIDPQTPDKHRKYSRRGWDGLIKQWRLKLHNYDPEDNS